MARYLSYDERQMQRMLTHCEQAIKPLCERNGYTYEQRNPEAPTYQFALVIGPDFKAVIYPHKTKSTGNRHIRLRDQGSASAPAYRAFVESVYKLSGLNCMGSTKHMSTTEALLRSDRERTTFA